MLRPYRSVRVSAEDDRENGPVLALWHLVLALETLNPTRSIHDVLVARVERV